MFRTIPVCCAASRNSAARKNASPIGCSRSPSSAGRATTDVNSIPTLPPDLPAIGDEEVGVALCLGQNPYDLDSLRVAAQFLSSPRINVARLCRLAVQERCEPVLLHIAEVAKKYAPEQEPWASLRKQLRPRHVPRSDALPHWTRLVSHTGITREGPPRTDWLRRHE